MPPSPLSTCDASTCIENLSDNQTSQQQKSRLYGKNASKVARTASAHRNSYSSMVQKAVGKLRSQSIKFNAMCCLKQKIVTISTTKSLSSQTKGKFLCLLLFSPCNHYSSLPMCKTGGFIYTPSSMLIFCFLIDRYFVAFIFLLLRKLICGTGLISIFSLLPIQISRLYFWQSFLQR